MKSSFLSSLLFSIRSLPFFLDSSFFLLPPPPPSILFSSYSPPSLSSSVEEAWSLDYEQGLTSAVGDQFVENRNLR